MHDLLIAEGIQLDPQGSTVKEIDEALKTASKSGKGNVGRPEYCGVVEDFLIVIEDKADIANHIYRDSKGLIDLSPEMVKKYAVNGAIMHATLQPIPHGIVFSPSE